MAKALRSVSWRLRTHDDIREGKKGSVFVEPFDYVKNSRCLRIKSIPKLSANTKVERVYSRAATATYVNLLRSPDPNCPSVIVKVMFTSAPTGSPDCLLSEHEVEVRMLLLLTALMRNGVTDSATIPLALGILRREQLIESGLMEPGVHLFPEPADGKQGDRYAVIFAEAAEACLTDVVWRVCSPSQRADFDSDYIVRATMLQCCLALASMHAMFPSFRHNDLHASNILVQHIDPQKIRAELGSSLPSHYPLMVEYEFCGRRWQIDVQRAPFRCLLWDFSFASIQERDGRQAGLDCVAPREYRFGGHTKLNKTTPNQYCDIQKLMDTLRWVLEQGDGWDCALSSKTRAQFDAIAPRSTSYASKELPPEEKGKRQRVVHSELQLTSPTRVLLLDGVFDDFRVDTTPKNKRKRPLYVIQKRGKAILPREMLKWKGLFTPESFTPST